MISSQNLGDISLTKRDGEKVALEKLNSHKSKKVVTLQKNTLGDKTKQTTDLQNKIQ